MAWWDPPAHKRMPTISGIKGAQIETEIAAFVELLAELNVRSYLEIGGKFGDTFGRVLLSLPDDAVGVLVDFPPNPRRQDILVTTFKKIQALRPQAHLILGNSHDPSIVQEVAELGPFDACLLDGDRTAAGLMQDWTNFAALSRMTALHDIRAAGKHLAESFRGQPAEGPEDMMAPLVWSQIKAGGFPTRELVDADEHVGIGVAFNHRGVLLRSEASC